MGPILFPGNELYTGLVGHTDEGTEWVQILMYLLCVGTEKEKYSKEPTLQGGIG